jgi:hypothetical protein
MAEEEQPQAQGAPSAPPMVAPSQPTAEAKPKRKRGGGNGRRGGRKPMSDAERAAAAATREQAAREREEAQQRSADARRGIARLASIAALSPHLVSDDETATLGRTLLAILQERPGQVPAGEGAQP